MNVTTRVVRERPGPGGTARFRVTITRTYLELAATVAVVSAQPAWAQNRVVELVSVSNATSSDLNIGRRLIGDLDTEIVFGAGTASAVVEFLDDVATGNVVGDTLATIVTIGATPYTLTAYCADDPFDRRGRKPGVGTLDLVGRLFAAADEEDTETLADAVAQGKTVLDMALRGLQGPQGANGIQGANGSQGTQGFQGAQGAQGVAGAAGTQGAAGAAGAQGVAGAAGAQGVAGAAGAQGVAGAAGAQGAAGAAGAQGAAGVAGSQGAQGAQGVTGSGSQGAQGAAGGGGSQGAQGALGPGADLYYWSYFR